MTTAEGLVGIDLEDKVDLGRGPSCILALLPVEVGAPRRGSSEVGGSLVSLRIAAISLLGQRPLAH